MSTFEQFLADGFQNSFGDTAIMGIMVLAFFGIFVMLQNTRFDVKLAIMVPAFILASAFIPWFAILLALVLGTIVYLAVMKLISR